MIIESLEQQIPFEEQCVELLNFIHCQLPFSQVGMTSNNLYCDKF